MSDRRVVRPWVRAALALTVLVLTMAGAPARADGDPPAQLLGFVQWPLFERVTTTALGEPLPAAFSERTARLIELWKDRPAPAPFAKLDPPVTGVADLGNFVGDIVALLRPRLTKGDRETVEKLLADLTTSRCLHGWSIAPNYSGPLDVTLSLLVSQTGFYEVLARMTPPARPDRPAKPDDFKGIQFTYPTGLAAKAGVTGTPRSLAAR